MRGFAALGLGAAIWVVHAEIHPDDVRHGHSPGASAFLFATCDSLVAVISAHSSTTTDPVLEKASARVVEYEAKSSVNGRRTV